MNQSFSIAGVGYQYDWNKAGAGSSAPAQDLPHGKPALLRLHSHIHMMSQGDS